ncbi:MAG: hypothetical protein H6712_23795 [Myxococcales bacterium]|nr:hypothetical protein [Myxococcales bacterium]MCB9716902.1 hypothetical protein [Myxococcales bacterium]
MRAGLLAVLGVVGCAGGFGKNDSGTIGLGDTSDGTTTTEGGATTDPTAASGTGVDPTATTGADDSTTGDEAGTTEGDDDLLYVAGGRDWMGEEGFTGATAMVQALSRPLRAAAVPEWEANPTDVDYVEGIGIETAADGYLYVGGDIDGVGVVLRCDKQGGCG